MNSKQDNLSATTAIVHGAVIIFAYTSPWWLDWRIVTGGVLLYYIQIFVFKGCVLSLAQFKGEKKSFHEWYLTKMGFKINRQKLRIFLNVILPPLFPIAAVAIQIVLRHKPYLGF